MVQYFQCTVICIGLVAKWLTLRFAKPTCAGSTPAQDSKVMRVTFLKVAYNVVDMLSVTLSVIYLKINVGDDFQSCF